MYIVAGYYYQQVDDFSLPKMHLISCHVDRVGEDATENELSVDHQVHPYIFGSVHSGYTILKHMSS